MENLPQIKSHKQLPTLTKGSTFVVGDLHGSYNELMTFLNEYGFDKENDRIIAVGDLIDRGEKSFECLNLLNEDWFYSVLGNHEYMIYDIVYRNSFQSLIFWLTSNGGDWIIKHFNFTSEDFNNGAYQKTLNKLMLQLKPLAQLIAEKMSLSIDFKTQKGDLIGISHASTPNYNWDDMINFDIQQLHSSNSPIWNRSQLADKERCVEGVYEVCHGHTILDSLQTYGNRNYIDTGLFMTNNIGFKIYK